MKTDNNRAGGVACGREGDLSNFGGMLPLMGHPDTGFIHEPGPGFAEGMRRALPNTALAYKPQQEPLHTTVTERSTGLAHVKQRPGPWRRDGHI
jgi:hypothetical protein